MLAGPTTIGGWITHRCRLIDHATGKRMDAVIAIWPQDARGLVLTTADPFALLAQLSPAARRTTRGGFPCGFAGQSSSRHACQCLPSRPGLSPRLKSTEILRDPAAYLNVMFLLQSIVID